MANDEVAFHIDIDAIVRCPAVATAGVMSVHCEGTCIVRGQTLYASRSPAATIKFHTNRNLISSGLEIARGTSHA